MSLLVRLRILRYAVLAALLATPPSAAAQVVCGDTIGPNETRVMTGHLSCNLALNAAAITIVGPATLDMNGFTLDCVNQDPDGVVLQGGGASVSAGLIANCNDAVLAVGAGGHKIAEVAVSNPVWGFTLVSSGNSIKRSTVENFSFAGYFVSGDDNKVEDSTAGGNCANTASTAPFFFSSGQRNKFLDNLANCNVLSGGSQFYGFHLDASSGQNKLIRNVVVGPRPLGGYLIQGSDHQLKKNKGQSLDVGVRVEGSGVRLTKNMLARSTSGIVSEPQASGMRGVRNDTFLGTVGLQIQGTQSVLVKNVSLGHGTDAEDVTNCATNTWKDTVSDPAKTSPCID